MVGVGASESLRKLDSKLRKKLLLPIVLELKQRIYVEHRILKFNSRWKFVLLHDTEVGKCERCNFGNSI